MPTFDAFFILYHAVRHMTTEGVGFRQVCDWTMYLHRHHAEINCEELQVRMKEYHMEAVWREFGILAVNVLGLPESELPLAPSSFVSSRTEKLLRHIFISGDFGRADVNGRDHSKVSYLKRKWRSFRFQSLRLMRLSVIFPGHMASFCTGWLSNACLRFIRLK